MAQKITDVALLDLGRSRPTSCHKLFYLHRRSRDICTEVLRAIRRYYATRDPVSMLEAAECLAASPLVIAERAPSIAATAALLRNDLTHPALATQTSTDISLRRELAAGASPALESALTADRLATAEMLEKSSVTPGQRTATLKSIATSSWPLWADVLSKLGTHNEARELISRTPSGCYACVRTRGLVEQRAGDAAAAKRWFREATRQAPRLAPAYLDMAMLLANQRRFDQAEVHFKKAVALAPNWADPIKYWGDALLDSGKPAEARKKYDTALELAPKWIELQRAQVRLRAN